MNFNDTFDQVDKKILYDSFISIIIDKDKQVRKQGFPIAEQIAQQIGKTEIEFQLTSERPILREKIKKTLRKIFPPEIPEHFSNKKKQRVALSQEPQPRITQKSVKSFQFHEFELESYILFIDSVINFEEPQDLEISLLHKYLTHILNLDYTKKIFSYQTSTIIEAYDSLQQMNVFTHHNIIAFLELIYIRVYDTCRKLVVNTFSDFLNHIKKVMEEKKIVFNGEKESSVLINTILRLYLNINYKNPKILGEFLELINSHYVLQNCFRALKQAEGVNMEIKVLRLIQETVQILKEDSFINEEMIQQLLDLKNVHKEQINFIFKILQKNRYFKEQTNSQNLKEKFEFLKSDNKEISLEETLYFLSQQNIDGKYLFNNCDSIIQKITSHAQKLFSNPTKYTGEQFDQILKIIEKLCSQKCILDYLQQQNSYQFLENLISFLLQIDKEKSLYRFTKQNQTLLGSDQIISSLNSSIIKLLDNNNPNNLLKLFLEMQEDLRLRIIQESSEEKNVKFKGILIRLILKLTKSFKKVQYKLEIKNILQLLYNYFVKYKDFSDSIYIKTLKTILNELTIMLGPEIFKYYENLSEKNDPAFLFCINKYIDKNVEKDHQKNSTKENVFYYN